MAVFSKLEQAFTSSGGLAGLRLKVSGVEPEGWKYLFLTSSQAMPMLLDQQSLFGNHCSVDVLTS